MVRNVIVAVLVGIGLFTFLPAGCTPWGIGEPDVCDVTAAPVTNELARNGITVTAVDDGTSSDCVWQDGAGSTTVTLKPGGAGGQDGAVVGVGPGEVTFTAKNQPWDLLVDSPNADDVDSGTATALVSTIRAAINDATHRSTHHPTTRRVSKRSSRR